MLLAKKSFDERNYFCSGLLKANFLDIVAIPDTEVQSTPMSQNPSSNNADQHQIVLTL